MATYRRGVVPAILLVAGIFVWSNLPKDAKEVYGWPCVFYSPEIVLAKGKELTDGFGRPMPNKFGSFSIPFLIVDIAALGAILLFVGVITGSVLKRLLPPR
jgi:hypothetical protein